MLDSIAFRHLKGFKRALDFAIGQDLSEGQMLIEAFASSMPSEANQKPINAWPEKVEQVCNRLNNGSRLYLEYRGLSERIHPGILSMLFPTVFDHPSPVDPGSRNTDDISLVALLARHPFWLAIGACAWAGWAADRLFATDHFGPLLAEFAAEAGFAPIFRDESWAEET
jgi:hypothetical protein